METKGQKWPVTIFSFFSLLILHCFSVTLDTIGQHPPPSRVTQEPVLVCFFSHLSFIHSFYTNFFTGCHLPVATFSAGERVVNSVDFITSLMEVIIFQRGKCL